MITKVVLIITITYLIVINIVAALVTIADKRRSVKGKWRIPEATLMILALMGGAVFEYITMSVIRHKTRHEKFMIGLPLIIFVQIVIIAFIINKVA